MSTTREYEFKVDFIVSKDRSYKKGDKLEYVEGKNYYAPIGKPLYRPVEPFFVENNPALFKNISRVALKLVDDNRFLVTSVIRSGIVFNVLHQKGTDLYLRKDVFGTPFLVGPKSLNEQFTVNKFMDGKTNSKYEVGGRIVLTNTKSAVAIKISKIDFDGTINDTFKLGTYKTAPVSFVGDDKYIYYPNPGFCYNFITNESFEVIFSKLAEVNRDSVKIFALKQNRYDYTTQPVITRAAYDNAVKLAKDL